MGSSFWHPQRRLFVSEHLSTRQYSSIVHRWVEQAWLDLLPNGTYTMGRTKAALNYRRTKNLRTVQALRGHTKIESTVRYLGIDVDDALEMAEQTEVSLGAVFWDWLRGRFCCLCTV